MPIDPNNQNYFSLDEQTNGGPTSYANGVTWWKERRYQKQMLVVAGIVVGVGLVGYYGYQMYTLTHVDSAKVEQANAILSNAAASCATEVDPQACEDRARADAARTTAEPSVCKGLTDTALSDCVSLIARDTADANACSSLTGADETACRDSATLALANVAKNYGLCATIVDVDTKAACQSQLLNAVISAGQCETYSIPQDVCDYPKALAAIIAAGNPQGCLRLSVDRQDGCSDMFSSLDQDHDGLSLLTEYKLGTSDTKADTDGDGYTDGQEVSSGHDPLK